MARTVLTIAGAAVGFYFGGPLGASIGATLGGVAGSYVDPVNIRGPRLEDLRVVSSAYGVSIPLIYGQKNRVAGNVIWSSGLKEKANKRSAGGKGGGDTITEYSYSVDVAISLGAGPCRGIRRIWANGKLLWNVANSYTPPLTPETAWILSKSGGLPATNVASIAFYPGDHTQMPDPTIEAAMGAGNVPAYRGTCYIVLTGLQLADYGNSLPNLEFELDGLAPRNVGTILRDLCERAGLTIDEYAVHSRLYTIPVQGYTIGQSDNVAAAMTPMAGAYFFDSAEQYGAIRFVPRGRGPLATVNLHDMAAQDRQDSAAAASPLRTTRTQDVFLPRQASLTYRDPALDYQPNTQRASRAYGDATMKIETALALTLDSGFARMVVDRILWEAWAARTRAQFSLSERFGFLFPADGFIAPVGSRMELFLLLTAQRGDNGQIDITAVSNDPFVYDGSTDGAEGILPPNEMRAVGDTYVYVFNAPILFAGETDTGFNWAMDAPSLGWRGGQIFRSIDNSTFTSIGSTGIRNITGTVAAALPAGPTGVMDDANTIDVVLRHSEHELSSVTLEELLNGSNAIFLGRANGSRGEVLQFMAATLLSSNPRTYRLSGLLRGRRATEQEVGAHVVNEEFVLLEMAYAQQGDFGVADWDVDRWYKGASVYQFEPDVTTTQQFVNVGERAKPRSPVFLDATRDGGNNLTVDWLRRVRGYTQGWGSGPLPLDEPVEAYEADVVVGMAVVRTISASTPTLTYTAADQTSDGITPGNHVTLRIYQISNLRGRGHPLIITV